MTCQSSRLSRCTCATPQNVIAEALSRLQKSAAWLDARGVKIIGASAWEQDAPMLAVKACPRVYALFAGHREQRSVGHNGVCRYEHWEATDPVTHVKICWTEVCA